MKKFKLPEKDYFTRVELAKQWECENELIDYYIERGLLREAVYTPKGFFTLQCCMYYRCDVSAEPFLSYRDMGFMFDDFNDLMDSRNQILAAENVVGCPTFAYLTDLQRMINHDFPPEEMTREDMENGIAPASVAQFRFLAGPNGERYLPIARKRASTPWEKSWNFEQLLFDDEYISIRRIIPREERDRFEQEHDGTGGASGSLKNPIATRISNASDAALLGVIRCLLDEVIKKRKSASQSDLIGRLLEQHGSKRGISKTSLEAIFSAANKN